MATIPYYVALSVTLSANQTAQMSYQVPQNWKMKIISLYELSKTGNYQVTGISDNGGINYTNATQSTPIAEGAFENWVTADGTPSNLPVPLELEGASQILIQLKDTSAAPNTVTWLLKCVVDY
jgi:hypothetical protein